MIIYIDENIPHQLAQAFDLLQKAMNIRNGTDINVRSIAEDFGRGAKDEDWIPLAGKEGACVITQDYNINRIRHQKALCEQFELGMIYFRPPSKNGFSYWDFVKMMTKHWEEIVRAADKKPRPFSFKVTSRNTKLEPME